MVFRGGADDGGADAPLFAASYASTKPLVCAGANSIGSIARALVPTTR